MKYIGIVFFLTVFFFLKTSAQTPSTIIIKYQGNSNKNEPALIIATDSSYHSRLGVVRIDSIIRVKQPIFNCILNVFKDFEKQPDDLYYMNNGVSMKKIHDNKLFYKVAKFSNRGEIMSYALFNKKSLTVFNKMLQIEFEKKCIDRSTQKIILNKIYYYLSL